MPVFSNSILGKMQEKSTKIEKPKWGVSSVVGIGIDVMEEEGKGFFFIYLIFTECLLPVKPC